MPYTAEDITPGSIFVKKGYLYNWTYMILSVRDYNSNYVRCEIQITSVPINTVDSTRFESIVVTYDLVKLYLDDPQLIKLA